MHQGWRLKLVILNVSLHVFDKVWARVNILENVLTQPGWVPIWKLENDSKIKAACFSDVLTIASLPN